MADRNNSLGLQVHDWKRSNQRGGRRKRLLFGLSALYLFLINYPFLWVVDTLLPAPATVFVLFGVWGLTIVAMIWIMMTRLG